VWLSITPFDRPVELAVQRFQGGQESVVDEEDFGTRIVQPEGDFGRRQPDIDRYEDAAGPRHSVEILVVPVTVEREHGGTLAVGDSHAAQRARQSRDPFAAFVPAVYAVAAYRRDVPPLQLHHPLQSLCQIHTFPPRLPVPRGKSTKFRRAFRALVHGNRNFYSAPSRNAGLRPLR
jgi:hypothetical protein